jgi:hypothetical protein
MVKAINDGLESIDDALTIDPEKYVQENGFNNTYIRNYDGEGCVLSILVDRTTESTVAVKLSVTDTTMFEKTVKIVQAIIKYSAAGFDDDTINTLVEDYQKYKDMRTSKNVTLKDFTFTYNWDANNYEFIVTKGAVNNASWVKQVTLGKMTVSICRDWGLYYDYGNLGSTYEQKVEGQPTSLKVSLSTNEISLMLVNLQFAIDMDYDKPDTVFAYLNKEYERVTDAMLTGDITKVERAMTAPFLVEGCPALETSYIALNSDGQIAASNRQFTILDHGIQYSVSINRDGAFLPEDLTVYNELKESTKLSVGP